MENNFCKIFVGNVSSHNMLVESICKYFEIGEEPKEIIIRGLNIEIRKAVEFDEVKQKIFPDGFLYFPFHIEIEFEDSIKSEAIVEVSELLNFLWSLDVAAVASCDYEEVLPRLGGYRDKELPWPN